MSTIPVITISNRVPHEEYYHLEAFRKSCQRQGFDPIYLGGPPVSGARNPAYRGLMSKPKLLKQWVEKNGAAHEYIIVCDCWDLIWLSTPSDALYNLKAFSSPIVFNAEKACFPEAKFAESFDAIAPGKQSDKPPYRYLNSGYFIGNTEAIRLMLQEMDPDSYPDDYQNDKGEWQCVNDQGIYQAWFLKHYGNNRAELDYRGILCQSLHLSGDREFAFFPDRRRVVSLLTGNEPICVHGNGSGKEWLKKMIGWLNL